MSAKAKEQKSRAKRDDPPKSKEATKETDTKSKEVKEKTEDRVVTPGGRGESFITPDPSNFDIKHPLQVGWTMWYNPPQSKKDREKQDWTPKKIVTFETVEDFWCLFNNLVPPTKLVKGSNYHLFKDGIQPEWEDPENTKGGKWTITYNLRDANQDDAWMYTLLALIGEEFEDSDQVCGCVISPRARQNKLALWTKDAKKKDAVLRIGKTLKTNISFKLSIPYQGHHEPDTLYTV